MKDLISIARRADHDDAIGIIALFAFLFFGMTIIPASPAEPVWICGAAGAGQASHCEVQP